MFSNSITISISGLILIIMLVALGFSFYIMKTINNLKRDFKEGEPTGTFESEVLKNIVKKYRRAGENNVGEINTQAIIEKEFNGRLKMLNTAERFVKHSSSLMIIFGLLGTFAGLTIAVSKLVSTLTVNQQSIESVSGVIDGLLSSIGGMSVAFTTSLVGIIGSIIITLIKVVINPVHIREELMVMTEEYLDNVIAKEFIKEEVDNIDEVEERFEILFDRVTEQVESGYKRVIERSVSGLLEVVKVMETNGANINTSVDKFDKTIDKFVANSREFSEFNHHLKDNISRMNVTLSDFTDNIKENITENIKEKDISR
ncbi:hypothetical protein [Oceanirhabdus seepicola]|uniref:MotA/TolQ/ExbB proton channel domain-containing protein n=1 Tax=Oceanirhabdus seepicola TaxID=2828781 RepID=A0A9J6P227_9CLOT|nr:hypothetical protein [Oceanirhabdus seepicola]MCM1990113.1 hypothetical protein [Oceanirhabdus seepicola]